MKDYPEISTDEKLLQVLDEMQKKYPKTPRGEKIYGMGMTGGSKNAGIKELICDYPQAKGYEPLHEMPFAYLNYGNMTVECPLTDSESFFWDGVRFYYEANRRGLLDPDSVNMEIADYEKKINKGIYLLGFDGTQMKDKENILSGQGFRKAGYAPLSPLADVQAVFRYTESIMGGSDLAISSSCKHPDKAITFLNWCFSEEGSRIFAQGTKGFAWEEKDGELELTSEFKKDVNLGIVEMVEKYGKCVYAENEEVYQGRKAEIIKAVEGMGIEKLSDWYSDRMKEIWEEFKPIMESVIPVYVSETS